MNLKLYVFQRICILLCLVSSTLYGQYTIKGNFSGAFTITKVTLDQYGLKPNTIATANVVNNSFSLPIPENLKTGIYRLNYSAGQAQSGFDLVVTNKENITFSLELSSTEFIEPVFSETGLNKVWFKEQNIIANYDGKIEVLQQAWLLYPDREDKIVSTLEKKLHKLVDEKDSHLLSIQRPYPFVSFVLRNIQPKKVIDSSVPVDKQDSLFIARYWDGINTNDKALLNTPVFSNLMFRYIDFFLQKNKALPKHKQDEELKQGIDDLLSHFEQEDTRAFAVDYLSIGFKQLGNEEILQYLDETYSNPDQCDNPNALNERLEGYKKLKPGNTAPAIIMDGKNILEHTDGKQTLLIFWASWCPHCMEEIPQLHTLIKSKDIRVVAVSLDTDPETYNPVKEKLSNMEHYCDFKKWDSQPVNDYYIKGTPTYFLLDEDNTIIKRYTAFSDLKANL